MLDFLTLSDVIIDTETLEKPESPQVPARIGIVCSQKNEKLFVKRPQDRSFSFSTPVNNALFDVLTNQSGLMKGTSIIIPKLTTQSRSRNVSGVY